MAPAVLLMGAAPLARWRRSELPDMGRRLRWAAVASLVIALGLLGVLRNVSALTGLGLTLAVWCAMSGLANVAAQVRHARNWRGALRQLPASYYGMLLAHIGVGVFIAGVTLVKSQESVRELSMRVGDTVSVGGYDFRFDGVAPARGPNYDALRGTVTVSRQGHPVTTLATERRVYRSQDMPTTEAAIDTGITRDLYVALGESSDATSPDAHWAMRIYVKPFVAWVWGGCALMALGGLLAAGDRRYRLRHPAASTDEAGETASLPARAPLPLPAGKESEA